MTSVSLTSCRTATPDLMISASLLNMEQVSASDSPTPAVPAEKDPEGEPSAEPFLKVKPAPAPTTTTTTTAVAVFPTHIEAWRPFVAVYFRPADVDKVLNLIECESNGDSDAVNRTAAGNGMTAKGLLQHLDGYWPSRAKNANEAGYKNTGDIFNGFDQLAVSSWLAYNSPQGFTHWECLP